MKHAIAPIGAVALLLASCGTGVAPASNEATPSVGFSEVGNLIDSPEGHLAFEDAAPNSAANAAQPQPIVGDQAMPEALRAAAVPGSVDPQQAAALFACRRMQTLRGKPMPQGYNAEAATRELAADPTALTVCSNGQ